MLYLECEYLVHNRDQVDFSMQRKPSKCTETVYWQRSYAHLCHEGTWRCGGTLARILDLAFDWRSVAIFMARTGGPPSSVGCAMHCLAPVH